MISIEVVIHAPVQKVWEAYNKPEHITKWNHASDDWHSPSAEVDLRPGGKFTARMEAKDGSVGFDFGGVYDEVEENKHIAYTMGDGRKARVNFNEDNGNTKVTVAFDAEKTNPEEMQRGGWQAILDNFKKYVESNQ